MFRRWKKSRAFRPISVRLTVFPRDCWSRMKFWAARRMFALNAPQSPRSALIQTAMQAATDFSWLAEGDSVFVKAQKDQIIRNVGADELKLLLVTKSEMVAPEVRSLLASSVME